MQELFIEVALNCLFMPYMWFTDLMDQTEMGSYYLVAIFIAMTTGFLLRRFGSALSLGSDKAAQHFKRKGDK